MTPHTTEFGGRVALITGAGAGIGRATAHRLALGGAAVVVTDKHEGRIRDTVADIIEASPEARVVGHRLDIEHRETFDDVFAVVERELGPIQIYVWNAALNVVQPVLEYDPDLFDRILHANANNCWYSCVRVIEHMKRAGGGSIVMVGSLSAEGGAATIEPAYSMSKAAIRNLMNGLVKVGGRSQIRVNEVIMAVVTGTRFADNNGEMADRLLPQTPLGRHACTEDIAEAIAFLVSDRATYVTGSVLNLSGGYHVKL